MSEPIEIFISYAHEDLRYLNQLKEHLVPLQNQGLIQTWHDADISPGTDWKKAIETHLETAKVILLLISSSFMASEYCQSNEMKKALERHDRGEARVIPIIVHIIAKQVWKTAPFSKLQALPKDAKPIEDWHPRTRAYASVVDGIYKAIEELTPSAEPREVVHPPEEVDLASPRSMSPVSFIADPPGPTAPLSVKPPPTFAPQLEERQKKPLENQSTDEKSGSPSEGVSSLLVVSIPSSGNLAPPSSPSEQQQQASAAPPTTTSKISRRRVLLRLAGGTAGLAILGGAYSCYRWIHPPPSSPVSSPFNVYTDAYARENHYTPTGFMGDSDAIKLTESWRENPHSGISCIRVDYSGTSTQNNHWAGVYWQDPLNNWGWTLWQTGYNLSKISQLSFWVRGNTGNEQIQFFVGGIGNFYGDSLNPAVYAQSGDANVITCTTSWQQITINLKGQDLTHIIGGFAWLASQADNPQGVTFYLDDIIFT